MHHRIAETALFHKILIITVAILKIIVLGYLFHRMLISMDVMLFFNMLKKNCIGLFVP
jgi:hypothetical protein